VSFNGVCARYRPGLPLVVKDLSFDVIAGEKVGVVGETRSKTVIYRRTDSNASSQERRKP
jgi:ABC-type multidrug transport system fused ATPase/permease subunit